MFRCYRLSCKDPSLQKLLSGKKPKVITPNIPTYLNHYLRKGGIFDGEIVEDDFFPNDMKFDVFISHFHKDHRTAEKLALYLEENLGLKVFLDFQYWGWYTELLSEIDEEYNASENYFFHRFPKGQLLNYEKCTFSSSVMHLMLAVALAKMIQNTGCVFFLHSEQDRVTNNYGKRLDEIELGSPWVYYELWIAELFCKMEKTRIVEATNESFQPRLKAPIENMPVLTGDYINMWHRAWKDQEEECFFCGLTALDVLYEMNGTSRRG